MRLFSVKILIIITAVTNMVKPGCIIKAYPSFVDFEVQCSREKIFNVDIYCHSEDWSKFPQDNLDLSSAAEIYFRNCSLPESMSVKSILDSMQVKITSQITFDKFRSIPSRKNLEGLSVHVITFSDSNITELPFDLLYGVLNAGFFQISETQLVFIREGFFSKWAENVLKIDMSRNKLERIAKNDFARLSKVKHIDLSYNNIEDIQHGAFDSLVHLNSLDLDNNRLHTLPSAIFHRLGELEDVALSRNSFDELPQDLFVNSKKLSKVCLHENNGTLSSLPPAFFGNLTYLEMAVLESLQLKSLPSDLFAGCSRLQRIVLNNNYLKSLPSGLFDHTTNLEVLELTNNRLESLPEGIFARLCRLNVIEIGHNRLTYLKPELLDDLQSVARFVAFDNNITQIDDQFMIRLKSATYIDLSNNQLTFENLDRITLSKNQNELSPMDNSTQLSTKNNIQQFNSDPSVKVKFIRLANNKITQFNAAIINILKYSTFMDLGNNPISKINLSDISLGLEERNKTYAKEKRTRINIKGITLHCDCDIMDLVNYLNGWYENKLYFMFVGDEFTCASPPEFENYEIRDIPLEDVNCLLKTSDPGDACNENCICREYPGNHVLKVDCSHRNFTQLPIIRNTRNWSIELNMTGNFLQSTPSLNESCMLNITSLDLSNNNITKVTREIFSPKLQQLRLHGNIILRLDSNVIDYLANDTLDTITLHGNHWTCDCETRQFLSFVRKKFRNIDFHDLTCYGTNLKLYEMTVSELCKDTIEVTVIDSLSIAFLGIILATLVFLYCKYQHKIKVWLYSKRCCLWFVTENELDKDREYDAFISFSHKDEDFVEKEIIAKLEGGPKPYKLCLHYRDWLAGEWIPVQISRSVAESRRTIVVLTPNFLESVWGLMEFRTAHTQALKEGRARLIVIIYGDIGNVDDLDQEMKDYLRLNTYIRWGDPWFWDKLRYALPHTRESARCKSQNTDLNYPMVEIPLTNSTKTNVADGNNATSIPKYIRFTNDSVNLLGIVTKNEISNPSC